MESYEELKALMSEAEAENYLREAAEGRRDLMSAEAMAANCRSSAKWWRDKEEIRNALQHTKPTA